MKFKWFRKYCWIIINVAFKLQLSEQCKNSVIFPYKSLLLCSPIMLSCSLPKAIWDFLLNKTFRAFWSMKNLIVWKQRKDFSKDRIHFTLLRKRAFMCLRRVIILSNFKVLYSPGLYQWLVMDIPEILFLNHIYYLPEFRCTNSCMGGVPQPDQWSGPIRAFSPSPNWGQWGSAGWRGTIGGWPASQERTMGGWSAREGLGGFRACPAHLAQCW